MKKYLVEEAPETFVTGLRRGYILVSERKESKRTPIPEDLRGIRGNRRKALEKFKEAGCTLYSYQDLQFPGSTRYCYTIYRGYKDKPEIIDLRATLPYALHRERIWSREARAMVYVDEMEGGSNDEDENLEA